MKKKMTVTTKGAWLAHDKEEATEIEQQAARQGNFLLYTVVGIMAVLIPFQIVYAFATGNSILDLLNLR